jgi:hypothetical protein
MPPGPLFEHERCHRHAPARRSCLELGGTAVHGDQGRARAAGGGRPTPARIGSGICSPPMTCPATGCMGTSSRGSAGGVPGLPAVPAHPVSTCGAAGDRAGQLQPAPVNPRERAGCRLGGGEQRGVGLRPDQRQPPEPDRGPVAALRYFTLDGTDHANHTEQGLMIRRHIAWRNRHARDKRLQTIVNRANVA